MFDEKLLSSELREIRLNEIAKRLEKQRALPPQPETWAAFKARVIEENFILFKGSLKS